MDVQINLWSLPGELRPGICPLGSCQRDICQRDICRLARRQQGPAEAVGGRRQLLFLRRPEKRHRGSRISTSKASMSTDQLLDLYQKVQLTLLPEPPPKLCSRIAARWARRIASLSTVLSISESIASLVWINSISRARAEVARVFLRLGSCDRPLARSDGRADQIEL